MNLGIIGAGGIALKMHLPQLAQIPEVRVTHIAGRKESRLRTLAERFDVPHWTTDQESLLGESSLDGIVVALPHPLHVPIGIKVIQSGKHLLMQKPLCADMDEANAFVAAADGSDRTVLCLPHFSPEVYAARRLVSEGAIGKPSGAHCRVSHGGPEVYYAEVRDGFGESAQRPNDPTTQRPDDLWFFKSDEAAVGALFDMGVYAVSVLVAALGSVRSVTGLCRTLDKPTQLEDTATLLLEFANVAVATAETGWCDPARTWQLRIHGTAGKLTSPGESGASLTRWDPGSYTREDIPPIPNPIEVASDSRGNAHEHWLGCIEEGRQPELSNAGLARHVTEVLLKGLESSRSGSRIRVDSTL